METAERISQKLEELRQEFAKQTAELHSEIVDGCFPWNFTEPCRVIDLWAKTANRHDITILRNARESKPAQVYGPLDYPELFPTMERILQEDEWEVIVEDSEFKLTVPPPSNRPGHPRILRQFQTRHYANLLKQISRSLYNRRPSDGIGNAGGELPRLTHITYHGSLQEIDSAQIVAKMISEAKRRWQEHQEYLRTKAEAVRASREPYQTPPPEGSWTCLFPWIALGPQPERTLWEEYSAQVRELHFLNGEDFFSVPDTPIRFTREGYVLVGTNNVRDGRRTLNHLAFLLNRNGHSVDPIGPSHIGQYTLVKEALPSGHIFSSTISPIDSSRSKPTSRWEDLGFFSLFDPRYVTKEVFLKIAQQAWALSSSAWANEIEWLMDAQGYHKEGQYSHSLLTSWLAIERILYRRLDQDLEKTNVPSPIRERIERFNYEATIRLAHSLQVYPLPLPEELGPMNRKRNDFIHRGLEVEEEVASRAISMLRKLLYELIGPAMTIPENSPSRTLQAPASGEPPSSATPT